MGTTTSKKSDNTGEIINNLTIEDVVKVDNKNITWLLCGILAILIIKLGYKLYFTHRRGLRKRYLSSPARIATIDNSTV